MEWRSNVKVVPGEWTVWPNNFTKKWFRDDFQKDPGYWNDIPDRVEYREAPGQAWKLFARHIGGVMTVVEEEVWEEEPLWATRT